MMCFAFCFFFFQAEDGIRDIGVTGVQTCALPISPGGKRVAFAVHGRIFTAPTDEVGELRQVTDGPVRDQDLSYSPDGKLLAFVSDKSEIGRASCRERG